MSQSAEIVQTHDVDHDDDNRDYESAMMTLVCSSPGPDHVEPHKRGKIQIRRPLTCMQRILIYALSDYLCISIFQTCMNMEIV